MTWRGKTKRNAGIGIGRTVTMAATATGICSSSGPLAMTNGKIASAATPSIRACTLTCQTTRDAKLTQHAAERRSMIKRFNAPGPWITRDLKPCVLASDYDALADAAQELVRALTMEENES